MQTLTKPENLTERIAKLKERLELGYAKIETAKETGKDTSEWENHWLTLLAEYEAIETPLPEWAEWEKEKI
jgi:hypothetical protein